MHIENGQIDGDIEVTQDFQLNGVVNGNVSVISGATFILNGIVMKDINITATSSCNLNGTVMGNVVNNGGTVNIEGVVNGIIIGSTNISPNAVIKS